MMNVAYFSNNCVDVRYRIKDPMQDFSYSYCCRTVYIFSPAKKKRTPKVNVPVHVEIYVTVVAQYFFRITANYSHKTTKKAFRSLFRLRKLWEQHDQTTLLLFAI